MSPRARSLTLMTALSMLVGLTTGTAVADRTCVVVDTETEDALPGVTLTWESSFLCANATDADTYRFTVRVNNVRGSSESVTIESLELTHTTPRPGGNDPSATGRASGLSLSLASGESATFTTSGTYELVETDEGKKANLHFQAHGVGDTSGVSFSLGLNAHFRAPGATESSGGVANTEASGEGQVVEKQQEPVPASVMAGSGSSEQQAWIRVEAGPMVVLIDSASRLFPVSWNGVMIT